MHNELAKAYLFFAGFAQYCVAVFFAVVIEENNVRLKLTITDTPGYGDQVNNENWWV